jgi:lysophospholipase L1-like esterase
MNFKKLMLLIGSVCFSLFIVEVWLRLFSIFPNHYLTVNRIYDENLGHKVNPRLRDIDQNGFRNKKSLKKATIVALGDSFTFGYNVHSEETWPQQLARMTNKTVYNFGVGEYGILQYYYLMEDAIKLQPQYIIMGLFLVNDLEDTCGLLRKTDFWKKLVKEWAKNSGFHIEECIHAKQSNVGKQRGIFDRIKLTLGKTAIGAFILHSTQVSFHIQDFLGHLQIIANTKKAVIINERMNKTIITHTRLSYNIRATDMNQPDIAQAFEIAKYFINEAKKKAELNNINFGVVLIPSKGNVFFDYLREKGHQLPEVFHRSVNNERALLDKFSSFFREIGLMFVDALPYVVHELYNSGNVYPVSDEGHPLEVGYKAYAEAVYNYILVPKYGDTEIGD